MFVPIRCCFSISTISQWFNIYHQEDYGFMFKRNRAREHQLSPEYLIFFFSRSLCFFLLLLLLYMYIIPCKILFHLMITRAEGGSLGYDMGKLLAHQQHSTVRTL